MKGTARDFFERESNRYDDFVKERDFVPSLVKKVSPLLRGRVLDVGSGCITDFRDAAFDLYLAFDLSMGMLSVWMRWEDQGCLRGCDRSPFSGWIV